MKLGDRIAIVCDHTVLEEAHALRATFECFKLQADLHRLVQKRQAEAFFAKRMRDYDFVVICCHGTLNPTRIKLEVIQPKAENPEFGDMVEFALDPTNIPTKIAGFHGVVVSTACESGAEAIGAAFLKAGCKAYLGPADYSDESSGMMFAAAFVYFLQYEWRLPAPEKWSISDAFAAAQKLDPRAKFGTKIWRLYEHK